MLVPTSSLIDCFVIDPPWPKKKGGLRSVRPNQGRALSYTTLKVPEIFRLLDEQVLILAATTHSVFLWNIDQFVIEGEAEMLARGYRRHARFIWDKGNGIAPCFTIRYSHEYLIWYYKPSLTPIAREQRGKFMSVLREPAREHSRKPDVAYSTIKTMYPTAICMDVFSREPRNGWLQWGDECQKFAKVPC